MSSPKWKYKQAETFSINPEIEALNKIKVLKKSMREGVSPQPSIAGSKNSALKSEMNPEKRKQMQLDILQNFKTNVN